MVTDPDVLGNGISFHQQRPVNRSHSHLICEFLRAVFPVTSRANLRFCCLRRQSYFFAVSITNNLSIHTILKTRRYLECEDCWRPLPRPNCDLQLSNSIDSLDIPRYTYSKMPFVISIPSQTEESQYLWHLNYLESFPFIRDTVFNSPNFFWRMHTVMFGSKVSRGLSMQYTPPLFFTAWLNLTIYIGLYWLPISVSSVWCLYLIPDIFSIRL